MDGYLFWNLGKFLFINSYPMHPTNVWDIGVGGLHQSLYMG